MSAEEAEALDARLPNALRYYPAAQLEAQLGSPGGSNRGGATTPRAAAAAAAATAAASQRQQPSRSQRGGKGVV